MPAGPRASWLTWVIASAVHYHPLPWLPEFVFGVALGTLRRRQAAVGWRHWPALASASIVAVFVLSASEWDGGACTLQANASAVDYICSERQPGGRLFFYHALAPLFGAFMYGGGAHPSPRGPVLHFLSRPVLVGLGRVSFQVYVFSGPFLAASTLVRDAVRARYPADAPPDAYYLVSFLALLWGTSAAFVRYVEEPAMRTLAARLETLPEGEAPLGGGVSASGEGSRSERLARATDVAAAAAAIGMSAGVLFTGFHVYANPALVGYGEGR